MRVSVTRARTKALESESIGEHATYLSRYSRLIFSFGIFSLAPTMRLSRSTVSSSDSCSSNCPPVVGQMWRRNLEEPVPSGRAVWRPPPPDDAPCCWWIRESIVGVFAACCVEEGREEDSSVSCVVCAGQLRILWRGSVVI